MKDFNAQKARELSRKYPPDTSNNLDVILLEIKKMAEDKRTQLQFDFFIDRRIRAELEDRGFGVFYTENPYYKDEKYTSIYW